MLSMKINLFGPSAHIFCVLLCVTVYFGFVYLLLTVAPFSGMEALSCFADGPQPLYQESK